MTFRVGEGIAGQVALMGETVHLDDAPTDPRFVPLPDGPMRVRSMVVAAIQSGEKRLGTLSINNATPYIFSAEADQLLATLGRQAGLAIENARLYADLTRALSHEKNLRSHMVQREKLVAMGRLVASVAHELNNPLQAIQNSLFLVEQEETLSDLGRQDLQVALGEVTRMSELVSRLRDVYRPTTNKEFRPGALNDMISAVHRVIATHLRHAGILYDFQPAPGLPAVHIIEDQIKQALLNLCLNAVEAMPDGGRLQLTTARAPDGGVVVSVTDTGIGINPDDLPNVFDPFFTTKSAGTGLGLAITYEIIKHHRGRIEVESTMRRGTTFRIWFPVTGLADLTALKDADAVE
jgi:two-component system NtrC family sensor kinase